MALGSARLRKRIAARKAQFSAFKITDQNAYLLQRINALCHARQIACRIVIEPIPRSLRPVDLSQLRSFVPDLAIVDINDFVDCPDSGFYDGLHLRKPDWTAYYRTVLSDKGLLTRETEALGW